MNEVIMLHGVKSRQILQSIIDKRIPAALSYMADGGWFVARALIVELEEKTFAVRITPRKKSQMANLQIGRTVGISFKLGYGRGYDKFVFDTMITGLCSADMNNAIDFILEVPEEIEMVPRRGYFRVKPPSQLMVPVLFWHRYFTAQDGETTIAAGPTWHSRLIDISASGMQIALSAVPEHDFKKGDNVGVKFTPSEFETPLQLNAQVRNIIPTVDGKNVCIGLEMLGLEASPEGRLILSRLVSIVEQYEQMNQH